MQIVKSHNHIIWQLYVSKTHMCCNTRKKLATRPRECRRLATVAVHSQKIQIQKTNTDLSPGRETILQKANFQLKLNQTRKLRSNYVSVNQNIYNAHAALNILICGAASHISLEETGVGQRFFAFLSFSTGDFLGFSRLDSCVCVSY